MALFLYKINSPIRYYWHLTIIENDSKIKLANANNYFCTRRCFISECSKSPSSEGCTKDKENCMIQNNPLNNVKKIIGIMSGKGGVNKSLELIFNPIVENIIKDLEGK